MAKRGENIRKRKDGRWEGRYTKKNQEGKSTQCSVFGKTYQETKEKLIKAKASLAEQTTVYKERYFDAQKHCFSKYAEDWFSKKIPALKESSISKYRNVLDRHLLPEFGEKKITEISRDDISAFSCKLLAPATRDGKGLAPKTVSGIISVMKNIMDYVRHVKCIPVAELKGFTIKQPQKLLRVFSIFEQNILNVCLLNSTTFIKLGILLCLYTGLRIGEICALKWEDISFEEHTLHVERTMQRIQKPDESGRRTQIIIAPPKSDCSVRDIPLPDEMFRILARMRQSDKCFFLTGLENTFIEPRTMENHFDRIMEACGIQNATMHTCRHTFATRCVEVGFDIKTLSEILGHASVAITMNRYVHPSMELKQKNMNKLSGFIKGQK